MTITTHDLFAHSLHLDDGTIRIEESPRTGNSARTGWTLAAFRVAHADDVHPDHWELHPDADEAVCVLNGAVRLILRAEPGAAEQDTTLHTGTVAVVPRGRWHRLELLGPSELMSITIRGGTRLQAQIGTG
jgi:mannose-6-phosphate isomerase-like protein (cupin superfamily)